MKSSFLDLSMRVDPARSIPEAALTPEAALASSVQAGNCLRSVL